MAGLWGMPEWLKCCCTNPSCPGCCMPVDEDGNPVDIPFEIDAPGCAIDGFTGVFNPLALSDVSGPCGPCGSWGYNGTLFIQGSFWNFNGIGCDLLSGCAIEFCMFLSCDSTAGVSDDPDNGACCRRMRLLVSSSYNFPGATYTGGIGRCIGLNYEIALGPDSCSCEGGLSAIFSLPINPLTETNPECGEVQPCVPDCDLTGLRVII